MIDLFKFIKGKTPLQHEQKGDRHCDNGAWGKAKLEFDTALIKLATDPSATEELAKRLEEKRRLCLKELSRQHLQSGEDLLEAGYLKEARDYFLLGVELTDDDHLRSRLQKRLRQTQPDEIDDPNTDSLPVIEASEKMSPPEIDTDEDETYFRALCNTLPADIKKMYKSYGATFRKGYIALNRGDFQTAVHELAQAQADNPVADSYIALELATAHMNLEEYQEARSLLEPFIRRHPDALPACRMLCEIFWENRDYGRVDSLLASVSQDLRESLAFILLHGENLHRQERYSEATAWYRTALNRYGWNQDIARALAVTLETTDHTGPARDLYREIIQRCSRCNPSAGFAAGIDPFARRRFAELSLANGDNSIEILELFLSLVRDDPVNAGTYYRYISQVYSGRGDDTEAHRFRRFAEMVENRDEDIEISH